jgi:hypothetical protein
VPYLPPAYAANGTYPCIGYRIKEKPHLGKVKIIAMRPAPSFANCLNAPGIFTGTIINRENIGKPSEELVNKWNAEFPDDQVGFSEN